MYTEENMSYNNYEENYEDSNYNDKGSSIWTLLLRILIIFLCLLLVIWIISKLVGGKKVVNDGTVFAENLKTIQYASEKYFFLAILGIMGLAFMVNLIELACSAGLPLLFTQILAINNLSTFMYGLNIFIYILFFLFDDLIIFTIAMITFKVTGISTKYTKYSHLIGGIIMLLIAILMIFKPDWLMFNF